MKARTSEPTHRQGKEQKEEQPAKSSSCWKAPQRGSCSRRELQWILMGTWGTSCNLVIGLDKVTQLPHHCLYYPKPDVSDSSSILQVFSHDIRSLKMHERRERVEPTSHPPDISFPVRFCYFHNCSPVHLELTWVPRAGHWCLNNH